MTELSPSRPIPRFPCKCRKCGGMAFAASREGVSRPRLCTPCREDEMSKLIRDHEVFASPAAMIAALEKRATTIAILATGFSRILKARRGGDAGRHD